MRMLLDTVGKEVDPQLVRVLAGKGDEGRPWGQLEAGVGFHGNARHSWQNAIVDQGHPQACFLALYRTWQ